MQSGNRAGRSVLVVLLLCLAAAVMLAFAAILFIPPGPPSPLPGGPSVSTADPRPKEDRFFTNLWLTVWWDRDRLPGVATPALTKLARSNIHPSDYSGPESCKKCHEKNYRGWAEHPHRWMNALANDATVKGDFSAGAEISYLGGLARFRQVDGKYRMLFQRGSVRREYEITQTIGSRFFQYYVGKLLRGPESAQHPAYAVNHVLPFGYWLDQQEWVPVVHVGYEERPDGEREDPFATNLPPAPLSPYFQCNSCHTTFPLGDELTRNFFSLGRHPPYRLHWNMPGYLREAHSNLMSNTTPRETSNAAVESLLIGMQQFEAPDHAVTLGVSCEACHLGCKEHAEGRQEKPGFFPVSPHLHAETDNIDTGRKHQNLNWACGRCHAGERPYYAGGMSTWNSTEYTDATKGGCYSQLTCVNCHNPHETIGKQWSRTPEQDDESCLKCHADLRGVEALTAHTHHQAGSAGSRCMNCHMPRLNEGLQNVVRTHAILSPTKPEMIEANHLNACNICHVEQPIDWTIQHLGQWYGATFAEDKLATNYPDRDNATVVGWLKSENEAVRLAATDAISRSNNPAGLSELIDVLDDPFLLNRQFARISLEKRFEVRLEDFGYQFYMMPQERKEPISRIRQELLNRVAADGE